MNNLSTSSSQTISPSSSSSTIKSIITDDNHSKQQQEQQQQQQQYDNSENKYHDIDYHALELLSLKAIQMNNHVLLQEIIHFYLMNNSSKSNNNISRAYQVVELIYDINTKHAKEQQDLHQQQQHHSIAPQALSKGAMLSTSSSTAATVPKDKRIIISEKTCQQLINHLVENYNWDNSCIVAMYMIECHHCNIPNNAIFFTVGGLMTKTAGSKNI